ncbi:MAG: SDR family oxidoreductase [Candidatus Sumerlaeia bacterium]|nr:SDR family oxidoreductase [Candidatus Sumerlaeia bacterium]
MKEGIFKGRVILVTGGGTGIGRAVALHFADLGAAVYLASRRENLLLETVHKIRDNGGEAHGFPTDVAKGADVASLISEINTRHGRIDVLVNAAGVLRIGMVHEASEEDFDLVFSSNVKGLWLVSKMAVPLMRNRENANIIHISSIAGTRTDPGLGLFEASKAAVNTLTKVMAKELAPEKIRVNAIAPGPIDTRLYSGSAFGPDLGSDDEIHLRLEELKASVPFGRAGTPEEVARLAAFLASPESDFISGSITSIDGAMGY